MAVRQRAAEPDDGFRLPRLPENDRQPQVAALIKQYIAANNLAAGDRLPGEEWFASALGVGRPLVREALKGLEAVGAVETRKGIGRFVGAFEPATYLGHFTTDILIQSFTERELAEARCLLEISAVAEAVERLTDQDLSDLQRRLAAMRERVERIESYIEEDVDLHRIIMRRTDNRLISVMLDAIYALNVARGAPLADPTLMAEDLAQHEAIVEAIVARDRVAARLRLMDHFDTTARRLGFTPHWHDLFDPPASPVEARSPRSG